MSQIELWVPGRPRTKQRPRLGRRRKVYTPEETQEAERWIAGHWIDLAGGAVFDGPTEVLVDYYADGQQIVVREAAHTSGLRGDVDNYLKLTLDGLQRGGAFNDVRVVSLWGEKH